MWFLLGYVFGRRRRMRRGNHAGLGMVGFLIALAGVLVGGLWVGVLAAMVAIVLIAAFSA